MEQDLYAAASRGNVESLREIIDGDGMILDKIVEECFSGKSPLHVAAYFGQAQFVDELLNHKPELAKVVDSQNGSALHIASAKGHVEIVKALIRVSPEMCFSRDQYGRNPLHVAAMMDEVRVLNELVRACPLAARVRMDHGDTILHLCVKHKKKQALELLVEHVNFRDLVQTKDSDGNTKLHLAIMDNQVEIVRLVVERSKIDVNATNATGHTAMDILLMKKEVVTVPEDLVLINNIEDLLVLSKSQRTNHHLQEGEGVKKLKDTMMIVASFIAAMAFQGTMNPPGGVWQENSDDHRAGEAIGAYNNPQLYQNFLRSNTIGFVASLSGFLMILSGLPFKKRSFRSVLVAVMWLTIFSMTFAYAFSIAAITPNQDKRILSDYIVKGIIVWACMMFLLYIWFAFGRLNRWVAEAKRADAAVKHRAAIHGSQDTV